MSRVSCFFLTHSVYDKITTESQKIRENMGIKEFLHKSPSKGSFINGIHSLLRRADVRGSTDMIVTHRPIAILRVRHCY